MIDALITGKLTRQPDLKRGNSGKNYCLFGLSVPVEESYCLVSCIAFETIAEKIAKLGRGDPLAIIGSLKPAEWTDKTTGEAKHGLSCTVTSVLSVYEIQKRRPKQPTQPQGTPNPRPFDDDITF